MRPTLFISLQETLDAVRPVLPRAIVGDEAWARARAIARHMPDAVSTCYLECRLLPGDDRVDFMYSVNLPAGIADVVAGNNPDLDLPAALLEAPEWKRIRTFLRGWVSGEDGLRQFVPITWMEFDIEFGTGEAPDRPIPEVGFCVQPELAAGFEGVAPSLDSEAFRASTWAALHLLRGEAPDPGEQACFHRCLEALPDSGDLVHLGATIQRAVRGIRAVVQLAPADVTAYLSRIGWEGDPGRVEGALETLCVPREGLVKIDVDICGAVTPRFAVASEFSLDGDAGYARAHLLLNRFVERDLCAPAKRDALREWTGSQRHKLPSLGWPVTINRMLDLKITVHHEAHLEAKSYLGINPCLRLFG